MFQFISQKLKNIFSHIASSLGHLFKKDHIDEATLAELEKLLLCADTGVTTTKNILGSLKNQYQAGTLTRGSDLRLALEQELLAILRRAPLVQQSSDRTVLVLVGINGSGKTTSVAKLAHYFKQQNKRVLLVAADTFRAAANQQLQVWADQLDIEMVGGASVGQDPASVVFQGCERFIQQSYDILIVDTAGRLQTKVNLMRELEKVTRIIQKKLPDVSIQILLTIDAMLGQNSFEQAKLFHESTRLNGIILTKMDGTGKGGIIFSIIDTLSVPVHYITHGERIDQITQFDADVYVRELLDVR